MINNVVLIGRLTRDVELRYTPNNVAVGAFNLAVNRNFKNAVIIGITVISTVEAITKIWRNPDEQKNQEEES